MEGNEITFKIVEHLVVLSESPTGWRKELNLVSWNGNPEKYDIRDWSADHTKMSKGVTLTYDQMEKVVDAVNDSLPFSN